MLKLSWNCIKAFIELGLPQRFSLSWGSLQGSNWVEAWKATFIWELPPTLLLTRKLPPLLLLSEEVCLGLLLNWGLPPKLSLSCSLLRRLSLSWGLPLRLTLNWGLPPWFSLSEGIPLWFSLSWRLSSRFSLTWGYLQASHWVCGSFWGSYWVRRLLLKFTMSLGHSLRFSLSRRIPVSPFLSWELPARLSLSLGTPITVPIVRGFL